MIPNMFCLRVDREILFFCSVESPDLDPCCANDDEMSRLDFSDVAVPEGTRYPMVPSGTQAVEKVQ